MEVSKTSVGCEIWNYKFTYRTSREISTRLCFLCWKGKKEMYISSQETHNPNFGLEKIKIHKTEGKGIHTVDAL